MATTYGRQVIINKIQHSLSSFRKLKFNNLLLFYVGLIKMIVDYYYVFIFYGNLLADTKFYYGLLVIMNVFCGGLKDYGGMFIIIIYFRDS